MLSLCGCGRKLASESQVMQLLKFLRIPNSHPSIHTYSTKLLRLLISQKSTIPGRFMSSVIYANHYQEGNIALVEVDLDLRSRFKNIKTLHENVTLRGMETTNVYHLASKYKTLRDVEEKKLELEAQKETIAMQMSHFVKAPKTDISETQREILISRGKEIREDLKEVNKYYYSLEEDVILTGLKLPVDLHPSTPIECDQIIKERGCKPEFKHKALGHMSIGKRSGTIYKKPVGPQQYYLRGKTAVLEQDIIYNLSQKFRRKGFTQMSGPDAVKTIVVEGSGLDIEDPEEVYVLQDKQTFDSGPEDHVSNHTLHLAGLSPLTFHAYITKMNFDESCLPMKWCAVGRRYNPSDNERDKGLFFSPQSTLIELFGLARDDSQAACLYENFVDITWSALDSLCTDLPLRMVAKSPEELKYSEAGRIDIEAWSSGMQQFIRVGYIAVSSDFVGRRLMVKWSPKPDHVIPENFIHTIHGTGINVFSLVAALMEHHQTKRGHTEVPDLFLE